MLGLNTYAILTTDTKLRLICSEAAQVREEHTYFLGMKRVDFTDAQADQIAKRFAVSLAESNGIPITEENVAFHSDENTEQASTTCTVTLDRFALPYGGGAFPSFLAREVSATVARMSVPAPAIAGFNGVSQEYGRISVKVPCYGGAIAVAGVHDPVRDLQNGTARQMADAPLGPLNCRRSFGIGVNYYLFRAIASSIPARKRNTQFKRASSLKYRSKAKRFLPSPCTAGDAAHLPSSNKG